MAGRGLSPLKQHEIIKSIYKWEDIAVRTEIVYNRIAKQPVITVKDRINR